MSATCPNGHVSSTDDYCDQCGAPIAAAPSTPSPAASRPAGAAPSTDDEVETSAAARQQPCPKCGSARTSDDRYCESCGYDFVTAAPVDAASPNGPTAAVWEAVAAADRGQFDRLAPEGVEFPAGYTARNFPLTGELMRIGRVHGGAPGQGPEINLAGAPEDPAISHVHAALERQADGSYVVRDLGSTNGTTVNDDATPLSADVAVPLTDGDRIRVGAWTTLTLRKL